MKKLLALLVALLTQLVIGAKNAVTNVLGAVGSKTAILVAIVIYIALCVPEIGNLKFAALCGVVVAYILKEGYSKKK